MERTANLVLLIKTFSFIVLILLLCAINIYIFVRHRRNLLTIHLHISSLFGLSGLFCLMMDAVILNLPFESIYRTAAYVSFILCGFYLVAGLAAIAMKKHRDGYYFGLSPNLEAVFSADCDLALVVDYRGIITQANHPEKLDSICQNSLSLMDVLSQLKENQIAQTPLPEDLSKLSENTQYELFFGERNEHILLKISPIVYRDSTIGFNVLFEDISAIRQSEIKLREQNTALAEANEKLTRYVQISGALDAQRERLQLLGQIQTTLIEKIEQAISSLRNIQENSFEALSYREDIKAAASLLRSIYSDVRASVSQIAGKDVKSI